MGSNGTMLLQPATLVAMVTVWMISHVVIATATDNYGGCGCYDNGQENGYARCVGVGKSAFNVSSGRTLRRLTVDCIGRSEIKSFNKGDVHKVTYLEIFNCGMESIGSYAFDGSDALKTVSFNHNSLRDISVNAFLVSEGAGVSAIWKLDLSDNQLEVLPPNTFTHMQSIRYIYFRNNRIKELADALFISSLALEHVDLGENRLPSVSSQVFRFLKRLRYLYLNNNLLTSVSGDLLPEENSLLTLVLSHNSIRQLNSVCMRLQNLYTLDLRNNELTSIAEGTFEGCSELRSLYLQRNMIADLSANAFKGVYQLGTLDISENRLTVLQNATFDSLFRLSALYLQENSIESLTEKLFQNMPLSTLNISRNSLKVIDGSVFGGLERFQTLFVSHNSNLTTIRPEAFLSTRLSHLDASHCSLQSVDFFRFVRSAWRVDLSHQNRPLMIPHMAFKDSHLGDLILSDNSFDSFEFLNWTLASTINLDNTNIKDHLSRQLVDRDSRYHQEATKLSLRKNNIEDLEEVAQLLSRNIRTLDLSENNILELKINSDDLVKLKNLSTLIVDHNQAADSMQIFPEFFNATDVSDLSLFGTQFSGLQNVDRFFYSLQLGGTSLTVFEGNWTIKRFDELGHLLKVTHAGLTSVPLLARSPYTWWEVDLNNNKLTRIFRDDFAMGDSSYPNVIDLSHNDIYWIEPLTFNISYLYRLDLSYNDIASGNDIGLWFSEARVQSIFVEINLSHNNIQTLPETVNNRSTLFSRSNLFGYVHLSFNPYHCNCEMHWFTSVICDALKNGHNWIDGGCVTPHSTAFRQMLPTDITNQCISPRIQKIESRDLDDGSILLTCVASGDPLPSVHWFGVRENTEHVLLSTVEPPTNKTLPDTTALLFVSPTKTDFVRYQCKANTTLPESSVTQDLTLTTTPAPTTTPPSTSTASLAAAEDENSDKKYTVGEMAGAVGSALIACLLLVGTAHFVWWKLRCRSKRQPSPEQKKETEYQNAGFTDGQDTGDTFSSQKKLKPGKVFSKGRSAAHVEVADTEPPRYVQDASRDTSRAPTPRNDGKNQPIYEDTELQGEYSGLDKRDSDDGEGVYEALED